MPAVAESTLVSRVQNVSGGSRFFGYLPEHGVRLADDEIYELPGDVFTAVGRPPGGRGRKQLEALMDDIVAGNIALLGAPLNPAPPNWRSGETRPITVAVATDTVVVPGDMIAIVSNAAVPASDFADSLSEAANQAAFALLFAGIAIDGSADGETAPIRVATAGIYSFACPSETRAVGDLVGADEHSGGTALLDQTVDNVANAMLAVGRVVSRIASATTTCLVEINSTVAPPLTALSATALASVTVALSAGAANTVTVTITCKNANGVAIAVSRVLNVYVSRSATGQGLTSTAASGALTATTGTILTAVTAKKQVDAITAATGILVLSLVDDAKTQGEYFVVVDPATGLIYTSAATVTGSYGA